MWMGIQYATGRAVYIQCQNHDTDIAAGTAHISNNGNIRNIGYVQKLVGKLTTRLTIPSIFPTRFMMNPGIL